MTLACDGIAIIGAKPDYTHPGASGQLPVETGTVVEAVRNVVPAADTTYIGKPYEEIYWRALNGVDPSPAVMIGDNLQTDIRGAERLASRAS